MDIATLADSIRTGSVIRRLTITGGEPLDQYPGLYELVAVLSDFDLALYTGYEIEEVPAVLIPLLNWIKVGRFEVEKRTTVVSYFGSTNQRFLNCRDILLPSYQDMRNEHKQ